MPTPTMTADAYRKLTIPAGVEAAKARAARVQREAPIQQAIMQALTMLGYTVLETSQHRDAPPSSLPRSDYARWYKTGNTKGIPDLLICKRGSPLMLGLEVKASEKAPRSKEQRALADAGFVHFVWSVEGALAICRKVFGAD